MSSFAIGMMPDEASSKDLRYDTVCWGEKYDFVDINTSFSGRSGYVGERSAAMSMVGMDAHEEIGCTSAGLS